jgi:hypothetical protein
LTDRLLGNLAEPAGLTLAVVRDGLSSLDLDDKANVMEQYNCITDFADPRSAAMQVRFEDEVGEAPSRRGIECRDLGGPTLIRTEWQRQGRPDTANEGFAVTFEGYFETPLCLRYRIVLL